MSFLMLGSSCFNLKSKANVKSNFYAFLEVSFLMCHLWHLFLNM